MSDDIESIISRFKPAQTSVPLCLDGELVAEYERLEVLLREAGPATSLADETSAEAIAQRMETMREQMLEARQWFIFRALPKKRWRGLKGVLPTKQAGQSDDDAADEYHAWLCKLVSATCIDPVMTQEQADRLSEDLSDGQWGALAGGAWSVNSENQQLSFSAAASGLTRRSAGKSRRPDPSASPDPSSLAEPSEPSPSTSTTTPDA